MKIYLFIILLFGCAIGGNDSRQCVEKNILIGNKYIFIEYICKSKPNPGSCLYSEKLGEYRYKCVMKKRKN